MIRLHVLDPLVARISQMDRACADYAFLLVRDDGSESGGSSILDTGAVSRNRNRAQIPDGSKGYSGVLT